MNVKLAKSAGFCFGVKRAVDLVYDQIGKTEGPIYTYGPIIHKGGGGTGTPRRACHAGG